MRNCGWMLLLLASVSCWAQTDSLTNKLSVGLNFMTHGEIRGGGLPRSGTEMVVDDRANFLLGRTRLAVDYGRPGLTAHAIIQNSAVWGAKGNQSLNLYEGWVRGSILSPKKGKGDGLFAQVGRVALAYDDERIIGPNDFAMASKSHDVLRMGYEGYGHKAHAILAYNQNASNINTNTYYDDGAQSYKTMHVLWYHYDVPKVPLGASLLFMNVGIQAGEHGSKYNPPSTEYQQMLGGYVKFAPKYLSVEGSYYRQMGKVVDAFKQASKIKAWMGSVKAVVKPADNYGFELSYDYLSGDDYVPILYGGQLGLTRHDVMKGFSPLYGSRTKFYGIMDYFYESAFTNGFTPGLQKVSTGVFFKPTSKLDCRASYHYLAVATDLNDLNRTLGHAVSLQGGYRFAKDISLIAGYTQMMGTETMDRLKQGESSKRAHWGWFSLVVSPSLFTTKW